MAKPWFYWPMALLTFLAELVIWFAPGAVAYALLSPQSVLLAAIVSVGLVVAIGVVWGMFMSPRAKRRLPVGARIAFGVSILAATAAVVLFSAMDAKFSLLSSWAVTAVVFAVGQLVIAED